MDGQHLVSLVKEKSNMDRMQAAQEISKLMADTDKIVVNTISKCRKIAQKAGIPFEASFSDGLIWDTKNWDSSGLCYTEEWDASSESCAE